MYFVVYRHKTTIGIANYRTPTLIIIVLIILLYLLNIGIICAHSFFSYMQKFTQKHYNIVRILLVKH